MQQQTQISLEALAHRLKLIESALQERGIIVDKVSKEEDEGELTDDFKAELERRRQTPESEYISFGEVKKGILKKRK